MAEIVIVRGNNYKIHSDFTTGDILLLASKTACRFEKALLSRASPVLRALFEAAQCSGTDIDFETTPSALKVFLRAVRSSTTSSAPPYPTDRRLEWTTAFEAIALAKRYECDAIVHSLLYAASAIDAVERRFDALVLASENNHHLAACRILQWGWQAEGDRSRGQPLRLSHEDIVPGDIARLGPVWVWALLSAAVFADGVHEEMNRGSKVYWTTLTGHFMQCLTKCERSVHMLGLGPGR